MARQTLCEQTAQSILDFICAHELTAGDKLPTEQELMAELSVGRNTVREALRSLASRNILTIRQGAGYFISEKQGVADDPLGFTLVEDQRKLTEDLLQIRCMIEPEIAALAAQNATPQEVAELERACQRVEEDMAARQGFSESDRQFHTCLANCSHNGVVSKLIPIISEGVTVFAATVDTQEYEQTLHSHRAILDAVRRHASCEARRAMEFHLLYNQNRYRH